MRPPENRFLSLDVFRGMTICFMIIVNTPGSGASAFGFLHHAEWHGFTPTDLVFPSFLFAVGNAMSFSMERFKSHEANNFFWRITKRTLLIFLLGYLMYWFPFFRLNNSNEIIAAPFSHTRIMGVLQRIALCYFFAAITIRYFSIRKLVWISAILLLLYWLLLQFGDHVQPYSLVGNFGRFLDLVIMGQDHLYHGEGIPFDPEGLLSTLPAIVNVICGYMAGWYIQKNGKNYETISKLMLIGAFLVLVAICWNTSFPINKKLWTSSFVLLTSGIDLMLIASLIYLLELRYYDILAWPDFFLVFGKNPLFIYLLSELLVTVLFMIPVHGTNLFKWINDVVFQRIAPGAWGSLLFAVCYMLFCWLIGLILWKRKIFIRV